MTYLYAYSLMVEYDYGGGTLLGVFSSAQQAKNWLTASGIVYQGEIEWVEDPESPGDETAIASESSNFEIIRWDIDDKEA